MTAGDKPEAGMTSNHHAPYDLGYTRTTMAGTTGSEAARWSQSYKSQSQFGLQAATRLHEVGISNRGSACRGEYVRVLYTPARHTTRVYNTRSRWGNPQGSQPPKVG